MKLLITADNHLRPDRPLCRTDLDWMQTQRDVIDFMVARANALGSDLVMAGDIFDVPRVPPAVVNVFMASMKNLKAGLRCYVIAGNHSLPWHKQENLTDSSVGLLAVLPEDSAVKYLPCLEGKEAGRFEHRVELHQDVLLVHTLTFPTRDDIPFSAPAISAYQLLDMYPSYKYIITGDNHHSFMVEDEGRYVINPGCSTIQTADMLSYQPKICYLDTDTNTIEWIDLPNDPSVLTDNHLKDKQSRNDRITAFIETVKNNGKISLSFEDNLRKSLDGVPDAIIHIIEELREELK